MNGATNAEISKPLRVERKNLDKYNVNSHDIKRKRLKQMQNLATKDRLVRIRPSTQLHNAVQLNHAESALKRHSNTGLRQLSHLIVCQWNWEQYGLDKQNRIFVSCKQITGRNLRIFRVAKSFANLRWPPLKLAGKFPSLRWYHPKMAKYANFTQFIFAACENSVLRFETVLHSISEY